jgi:hypothetical protein
MLLYPYLECSHSNAHGAINTYLWQSFQKSLCDSSCSYSTCHHTQSYLCSSSHSHADNKCCPSPERSGTSSWSHPFGKLFGEQIKNLLAFLRTFDLLSVSHQRPQSGTKIFQSSTSSTRAATFQPLRRTGSLMMGMFPSLCARTTRSLLVDMLFLS